MCVCGNIIVFLYMGVGRVYMYEDILEIYKEMFIELFLGRSF